MSTSIAIIGAGPAGLVFTISLARRGISSTIFEAMESPLTIQKYTPSRSYAIDITGHGLNAVRYIDAVDEFDQALIPFKGLQLNGKLLDAWTETGWIGSRGDILSVLTTMVLEQYREWINIHYESTLESIDIQQGSFKIRQAGTEQCEQFGPFDLVVAADGGGSVIREQAEAQEPSYHLIREDVGSYFKMLELDQNTTNLDENYLQLFLKTGLMVAGAINGPGGKENPLWFCAGPYANDQRYKSLAELKRALNKRCPAILEHCSEAALIAYIEQPAQNVGRITRSSQLYAGRVVFLGDAAVSFPPIGQGVNGAMESATVLDQALIRITSDHTVTRQAVQHALLDFNACWFPETEAVAWIGRKTNLTNRWHVIRNVVLSRLGLAPADLAKSSTLSYSQAVKRSKKLGPVWWG